ncbi:hypothetical protein M073_1762 [Bacteroides fragilis str. DS-71]|nr:hypothetical protein M073_1762 [Bacteroides fragilis str. DS-71]
MIREVRFFKRFVFLLFPFKRNLPVLGRLMCLSGIYNCFQLSYCILLYRKLTLTLIKKNRNIMAILNSNNADVLCTTIAVGFIHQSIVKRNPQRTQLIYEQKTLAQESEEMPMSERQRITKENAQISCKNAKTVQEHKEIQTLLAKVGCHVDIKEALPQSQLPFIGAKHGGMTIDEFSQWAKDFKVVVDQLQKVAGTPLRGAYIGGLYKIVEKTISFIGASKLEIYPPHYREIDTYEQEKISTAYKDAAKTTNQSLECIRKVGEQFKSLRHYIPAGYLSGEKTPDTVTKELLESLGILDGKFLFKSNHGMTQAIMQFGNTMNKGQEMCVEFALSSGTSKIGSCIPCSIFMEASGMPATATHLGCGDNWSIPNLERQQGHMLVRRWQEYVNSCYNKGCELLRPKYSTLLATLGTINSGILPDVFLEALTYEKPFIERMMNTLKQV